jgi:hypothetical protein
MSFPDPGGPMVPHDVGLHARVVRDELRTGGFRPWRRPKRPALAVLFGLVLMVLASFTLFALCDWGQQDESSRGFSPVAIEAP